MSQLNKDLYEAIDKNLAAQVGTVLKERLEKAEKDADRIIQLEAQEDCRILEIHKLENNLREAQSFNNTALTLKAREEAIGKRENEQEVFEAKLKLAEVEKRISEISNFTGMVFKSPIFRTQTSDTEFGYTNNQGFYSRNGGTKTTDISEV